MNQDNNALVCEANKRLVGSSHLFLRHVRCRAETGDLFLEGKVPSYFLKQTAQSLLQSIEGVDRVVNRLRVVNAWGAPLCSEPHKSLVNASRRHTEDCLTD